jgi:hypothetical protein
MARETIRMIFICLGLCFVTLVIVTLLLMFFRP